MKAWTINEIRRLRRAYPGSTATEIAAALGRSVSSVRNAINLHGLGRRIPRLDGDFQTFLRRKHAAGWSDAEVATAWPCDRESVRNHRRKLGLSANGWNDRQRQRVRQNTDRQLRAVGAKSLAEIRARVFARRAIEAGWPSGLRPRAVQMLTLLWERGPMTRRELSDAMGMHWHGSRASLRSNDPERSYLANLIGRGLVVCLGKKAKGKGRGCSRCLYSLPLWIQRGKVKHEQERNPAARSV